MLMNKLLALCKWRSGSLNVLEKFKSVWKPFMDYWNKMRPSEQLHEQIFKIPRQYTLYVIDEIVCK